VDMWTTLRLAHIPTGEQNQKKRTYDVLPKPDNFIRYRHAASRLGASLPSGAEQRNIPFRGIREEQP